MEKFTLYIKCDGAAFDETPASEIARILRSVADKIEAEGPSGFYETIRDINGNDVGRHALKTEI